MKRPGRHDGELTVPALIAARSATAPEAVAVVDETGQLTYGELDRRAAAIAGRLRARGIGRHAVVGVLISRSATMVAAWLGVLRSGAAYLPLDPGYPIERLRLMLTDAQAAILLTEPALAARSVRYGIDVDIVDPDNWPVPPGIDMAQADVAPDDLAYVIYTSGSTGAPKGALIEHRNILNTSRWYADEMGVRAGDRAGQTAASGFDVASWELWGNLIAGAEVHIAPERVRNSPEDLCRWISRSELRFVQLITPLAALAIRHGWLQDSHLDVLMIGGEKLHVAPPSSAPYRCYNLYGPTETAVVATYAHVENGSQVAPPIGGPIAGTAAHVVDESGDSVPIGGVGELCLGGAGVGRGYLSRPGLTARRFRPDPTNPGRRRYGTGDLVRQRADGQLEFVGRVDDQIKIQGFRIELAEIETQLRAHPDVTDAAVTVFEPATGYPRLVGYVCGGDPDCPAIRRWLGDRLPAHMVPSVLLPLAELPLTDHQKLDRAALPDPQPALSAAAGLPRVDDPRTSALAEDWQRTCGVVVASPDDTLATLGAGSLDLVALHLAVAERCRMDIPMLTLKLDQTLTEQVRILAGLTPDSTTRSAAPGAGQGPGSIGQESIAFLEEVSGTGMRYQYQMVLDGSGSPDHALLERALLAVARGQQVFTSRWRMTRDGLVGTPEPLPAAPPRYHEVTSSAVDTLVAELIQRPIHYTDHPLIRWDLISHPGGTVLLQREHHLVHDGWSIGVFLRQLQDAYRSLERGDDWCPEDTPLTYFDWARRQREMVSGTAGADAGRFWADHLAGVAEGRPELAWADPGQTPGIRAERLRQDLDVRLSARLDATAATLGVSSFCLFLATFRRLTTEFLDGRPRAIGSSIANRDVGTQDIVGMFVNVLPLHREGAPDETAAAGARAEMSLLDQAGPHQWLPTAEIVRRAASQPSLDCNPLYQLMFSQHDAPMPEVRLGDWRPAVRELPNGFGKVDLDVIVRNRTLQHARSASGTRVAGPYSLHWYHDPSQYPGHLVRGLQSRFEQLLDSACRHPHDPWPTAVRFDRNGVCV